MPVTLRFYTVWQHRETSTMDVVDQLEAVNHQNGLDIYQPIFLR